MDAKRSGILRGAMVALSGGLVFGIMYAMYGLGFWFGIKLIMDDRLVLNIFIIIMIMIMKRIIIF